METIFLPTNKWSAFVIQLNSFYRRHVLLLIRVMVKNEYNMIKKMVVLLCFKVVVRGSSSFFLFCWLGMVWSHHGWESGGGVANLLAYWHNVENPLWTILVPALCWNSTSSWNNLFVILGHLIWSRASVTWSQTPWFKLQYPSAKSV